MNLGPTYLNVLAEELTGRMVRDWSCCGRDRAEFSLLLTRRLFCLLVTLFLAVHGDVSRDIHGDRSRDVHDDGSRDVHGDMSREQQAHFPCVVFQEPGGAVVDCRSRALLDVPTHEIPQNAVKLYLDDNSIDQLRDNCFGQLPHLKVLTISRNNLKQISRCAFCGLAGLELLDLEKNHLDLNASMWENEPFIGLSQLRTLNLLDNKNDGRQSEFHCRLLSGIYSLDTLSLDTFYGNLTFGVLFANMTSLDHLTLSGGVSTLVNNSFQSLQTLGLKALTIKDANNLHTTELDAFQHLPSLQSLRITSTEQGIEATLRSLYPFRNRSMKTLYFSDIGKSQFVLGASKCYDGVIDAFKVEFLSQICVENFSLLDSRVFVLEGNTLTRPLWQKCVQTLDISNNPLIGDRISFIQLMHQFKVIKTIRLANRKEAAYNSQRWNNNPVTGVRTCRQKHVDNVALTTTDASESGPIRSFPTNVAESRNLETFTRSKLEQSSHNTSCGHMDNSQQCETLAVEKISTIYFSIPKTLQILHMESFSRNLGPFSNNIIVTGGKNLRELYLPGNSLKFLSRVIKGISGLETLDISDNDCSVISPVFFQFLASVKTLKIRGALLDSMFMSTHSEHLFRSLTKLRSLDLSNNQLNLLSRDTFQNNSHLQTLNLANNRFTTIPLDLTILPNLTYLDLSRNSISQLSVKDMQLVELHAGTVTEFSLHLTGNMLVCTCSSIQFLTWLQNTKVNLDRPITYSCLTENGTLTTTADFSDVRALWRKCQGQTALLISVIVLCLMSLGFVVTILCWKMKTRLKSFIYRVFLQGFVLHRPRDYRLGVLIGYADADTRLACFTLRDFIHSRLGLSTYVRDINLLPASDMAESIVDAVNSSWRIVLLVTSDYLDRDLWSYFTMKTAAYTVSPSNPGLIVVLLEETVRHRIPACLLRALEEDCILYIPPSRHLSRDIEDRLARLLLPSHSYGWFGQQ
ncbi:toll-like receptor 4 [Aplysia californica]|uniref:Toll-like receptor 4 n=1 Tax=Aplysia californica TaxID=6500 RepID=A0ABM1A278_APLCA|nr:toll-like receptor 4 [Aplysia californica]